MSGMILLPIMIINHLFSNVFVPIPALIPAKKERARRLLQKCAGGPHSPEGGAVLFCITISTEPSSRELYSS